MRVLHTSTNSQAYSNEMYQYEGYITCAKYFMVHSVKQLFHDADNHTVTDFKEETYFYDQVECLLFQFYISSVSLGFMFLFTICY